MNEFDIKLNALKTEHKALVSAIWDEYSTQLSNIKKQIKANKGQEVAEYLIQLRTLTLKDRDRKISKACRTYHFKNKEITAQQLAWAAARAV